MYTVLRPSASRCLHVKPVFIPTSTVHFGSSDTYVPEQLGAARYLHVLNAVSVEGEFALADGYYGESAVTLHAATLAKCAGGLQQTVRVRRRGRQPP